MSYDNWKTTDTNDQDVCMAEEPVEETPCEPYMRVEKPEFRSSSMRKPITITAANMRATFGCWDADGYQDDEGGYDGLEWTFCDENDNHYKVYFRWNHGRIGTHHEVSDAAVDAFADWLARKCGA